MEVGGALVKSTHPEQPVELQANVVELVGSCDTEVRVERRKGELGGLHSGRGKKIEREGRVIYVNGRE